MSTSQDVEVVPAHEDVSTAEPDVADNDRPASTDAPLVFVSYRVVPDEPLARAMKGLIESAITPKPRVFVSGVGGIRPSNKPFREQLDSSVREANAFVAVITPASREREWIFFEAGAAWGQDKFYAPLLFGVEPRELPTTIGAYQAVLASREGLEILLKELANHLGLYTKGRLGTRIHSFLRAMDARERSTGASDQEQDELSKALGLAMGGKQDEANVIFDKLEAAASGPEALAQVKVIRLLGLRIDDDAIRAELMKFDESLRNTAVFHRNMGYAERVPALAISHLEKCLLLSGGDESFTFSQFVEKSHKSGRIQKTLDLLVDGLRSTHPSIRAESARLVCRLDIVNSSMAKMIALCLGLAASWDASLLETAVDVAHQERWYSLAIYLADAFERKADRPGATNKLGNVLDSAGLRSRAFLAYARSASAGASVAKLNMARLLNYAVPAAGLKLLDEHAGPFDCDPPDAAYRIRAELEAAVNDEQRLVQSIIKRGERLFYMLIDLAYGWSGGPQASLMDAYLREDVILRATKQADDVYELRSETSPVETVRFVRMKPFAGMWAAFYDANRCGFYRQDDNGVLSGLEVKLDSYDSDAQWSKLIPVPASAPLLPPAASSAPSELA